MTKLTYTCEFDEDCMSHITIELDGEKVFSAHDSDSLEDCNLGRNFSDCWKVEELMKRCYELGKSGETLEIEKIEIGL